MCGMQMRFFLHVYDVRPIQHKVNGDVSLVSDESWHFHYLDKYVPYVCRIYVVLVFINTERKKKELKAAAAAN